tara:strand:+ start:1519 stop:2622 length:1104 start_codon:yes stop_codon:yes gene_type:complete
MNFNYKLKNYIISVFIYLFFFIIGDILFSNFIYKKDFNHNCYNYKKNFFDLKKNCHAKEKWVRQVKSYDVYTDSNGFRYSGRKNNESNEKKVAVFFGDSFTYGMGLEYKKTFIGLMENRKKEYQLLNLGVPGYSPSVFNYQLKNLLKNNLIPNKIFFVLDLSDVSEEASQWDINKKFDHPIQINISTQENLRKGDENKLKENFKGSRLIARSINNFFRNIRLNISNVKEKKKIPGYSGWGNFLYMDLDDTDQNLWKPFGFNKAIDKIKENTKEISLIANSINADFYIVIYPWPDTLHYGQKSFNWEKFSNKLCEDVGCTKLINLFPDFINIKENSDDWLTRLYIGGDLHISEYGQKIVAERLLKESF